MSTTRFTRSIARFILLVSVLMLAVLSACAPASPQPAAPTQPQASPTVPASDPTAEPSTGEPTTAAPPASEGPFTVEMLESLKPDDILVQFAEEPTFTLPEWRFAFGRVPPFTLFADGRLIYLDEMNDYAVMLAQLSPEETVAMLNQVHELGFAKLEDYTEMCSEKDANGEQMCVADASYHILNVRMADGTLRSVRNYHDFSNEPEIYQAINTMVVEYDNTQAVQYVPAAATLFLRPIPDAGGNPTLSFPLDTALLEQAAASPDQLIAVALNEEQVKAYLSQLTKIGGNETFEWEGKFFNGRLVPWLPGMDFTKEIQTNFPQ